MVDSDNVISLRQVIARVAKHSPVGDCVPLTELHRLVTARLFSGNCVFFPTREHEDFVQFSICFLKREPEGRSQWLFGEPWVVEAAVRYLKSTATPILEVFTSPVMANSGKGFVLEALVAERLRQYGIAEHSSLDICKLFVQVFFLISCVGIRS